MTQAIVQNRESEPKAGRVAGLPTGRKNEDGWAERSLYATDSQRPTAGASEVTTII